MEWAVLVLLRCSAPMAGRARRRRSGSASVRDNSAHFVDDETQHDHDRYDGADDGTAAPGSSTGWPRVGPAGLAPRNAEMSVGHVQASSCVVWRS
jgi:hypothetical protein